MKVIMIPVADRPECRLAMDAAFGLAIALSGNIVGCHLRPHRDERITENPRSFLGFRKSESLARGLSEEQIELGSRAAREVFLKQASAAGFEAIRRPTLGATRTAQWIEMIGSLDKLYPIVGPTSDVSVVSRPKRGSKGPGSDFMLAALLETGKPAIVLPQTDETVSFGKRILIAWNQSIEAARAVSAAIPLLQLADSVRIVAAGPESRPGPKSAALVDYLKYWGIKASRTRTKGADASAEIFAEYRKHGSDLIVMGAYSRGRFRERLFGGVTEDLLFRSSAPVFTLHS